MASLVRPLIILQLKGMSLLFNPLFTGGALWALTRSPPAVQSKALELLARLPYKPELAKIITILTWLFGLGALKKISNFGNKVALNGWRVRSDKARWNWPQEIAVVTGGAGGIGRVIVDQLLAKRIRVAVLDILSEAPADLQKNDRVLYIRCDITDVDSVNKAADEIRQKFGSPSILVNNAGCGDGAGVLDISPDFLKRIMGVNLMSHFYTCAAFGPDMVKANKGHIVTVASMASFVSLATTADYAATKAGVLAFHEALTAGLRNQYKAPNVHTTSVHPSWVRTPLVMKAGPERVKKLGKLLEVEDVGRDIAKAIFSCRGGQLVLPPSGWFISCLRSMPNWFQEFIRDEAAKQLNE